MSREIAGNFIISLGTETLWVIALVFMFVAKTRFPVKQFIVNVLRKRYDKILVKNVRKFKKYTVFFISNQVTKAQGFKSGFKLPKQPQGFKLVIFLKDTSTKLAAVRTGKTKI